MAVFKKLVSTFCMTVFFVYMTYILVQQQAKLNKLDSEIATYNKEIQKEALETENLNNVLASISEDEYMEEVARVRLGLVMPSETIFVDASI